MYTQVVVGGATGEGLSASDKDTSLREWFTFRRSLVFAGSGVLITLRS